MNKFNKDFNRNQKIYCKIDRCIEAKIHSTSYSKQIFYWGVRFVIFFFISLSQKKSLSQNPH